MNKYYLRNKFNSFFLVINFNIFHCNEPKTVITTYISPAMHTEVRVSGMHIDNSLHYIFT